MAIVLATFGVVLAVVLAASWLVLLRPDALQQRELRRRMKGVPAAAAASGSFVKVADRLSAVGPLNAVLVRMGVLLRPLQDVIRQSGLNITVGTLVLACGCVGLGTGLAVAWFSRLWWIGVFVGAVVTFVPYFVVRQRASSRILVFEEQFPEAIELISRALRAGHAFTTGLAMVAEEAPQPVAGEFRTLYDQQNFGMALEDALRAFAQRIPLLDARFFVTAVLTQHEAGGNLAEILDNLASVIRDRFRVKRQVRVITAHARITGWVLAGLPPSLAVVFMVTSPNHMMTLINDPLGVQMVILALALQVAGTLIIRRLVEVQY